VRVNVSTARASASLAKNTPGIIQRGWGHWSDWTVPCGVWVGARLLDVSELYVEVL
jgi:hypothetical protein